MSVEKPIQKKSILASSKFIGNAKTAALPSKLELHPRKHQSMRKTAAFFSAGAKD